MQCKPPTRLSLPMLDLDSHLPRHRRACPGGALTDKLLAVASAKTPDSIGGELRSPPVAKTDRSSGQGSSSVSAPPGQARRWRFRIGLTCAILLLASSASAA